MWRVPPAPSKPSGRPRRLPCARSRTGSSRRRRRRPAGTNRARNPGPGSPANDSALERCRRPGSRCGRVRRAPRRWPQSARRGSTPRRSSCRQTAAFGPSASCAGPRSPGRRRRRPAPAGRLATTPRSKTAATAAVAVREWTARPAGGTPESARRPSWRAAGAGAVHRLRAPFPRPAPARAVRRKGRTPGRPSPPRRS